MCIVYVCSNCNKKLKLTGFFAVNEVGRKYCEWCGTNVDDLLVVDKDKCDKAIYTAFEKDHPEIPDENIR